MMRLFVNELIALKDFLHLIKKRITNNNNNNCNNKVPKGCHRWDG